MGAPSFTISNVGGPSSMMPNFQAQRLRYLVSRMTISYEVIKILPVCLRSGRNGRSVSARSSSGPWYTMASMLGAHLATSFFQLSSVEAGPTTMKGPSTWFGLGLGFGRARVRVLTSMLPTVRDKVQ